MTDREAFIAAIIDNPDDDTPRLVFADWLEEHGEPDRAFVIRGGLRIARLGLPEGPCPPGCPCGGDGDKIADLIRNHGDEWAPLLPGERPGDLFFQWGRGFPLRVTCTAENWLAHADGILAGHPVSEVTLSTLPDADHLHRLIFADRDARRRLLPRGMGRHNRAWYAFWNHPDLPRALSALWPRVKTWNLPPTLDLSAFRPLTDALVDLGRGMIRAVEPVAEAARALVAAWPRDADGQPLMISESPEHPPV